MPNKYEIEKFDNIKYINLVSEIHNNFYNYSLTIFTSMKDNIVIICPKHDIFFQRAGSHFKHGCQKCAIKRVIDQKRTGTSLFIKRALEVHGNKYSYEFVNYINDHTQINIFCNKHQKIFPQRPADHVTKRCGCPECGIESRAKKNNLTTKIFIKRSKEIYGDRFDYSESNYINIRTKISIKCIEHNEIFEQLPRNHFFWIGCKKCKKLVSNVGSLWLDLIGLPNDKDHREVDKLISGRSFIVDGYSPETNTIYEFYGDRFHGNPKTLNPNDKSSLGRITFGELYKNTMERENIFRDCGYNIITIWESDFYQDFDLSHWGIAKNTTNKLRKKQSRKNKQIR